MFLDKKVKELQKGIHHNTSSNDLHCISEPRCEKFLSDFLVDFARENELEIMRLKGTLELIASPMRPDGTYNRDRKACELLAKEALAK